MCSVTFGVSSPAKPARQVCAPKSNTKAPTSSTLSNGTGKAIILREL